MNLQEFMNATGAHVSGGSEYQWGCFPDARFMDISDIDGNEIGSCVFSTSNQNVFEIVLSVEPDDLSYRWTDPDWEDSRKAEAKLRGIDDGVAYDDVFYTEIKTEDEILKLASSITHMTYVHSHVPIYDESIQVEERRILVSPKKEELDYSVKLTVVQCISVKATSMEEAIAKSKRLVSSMSPDMSLYSDDVYWEDNYFSKEEVSREVKEGFI